MKLQTERHTLSQIFKHKLVNYVPSNLNIIMWSKIMLKWELYCNIKNCCNKYLDMKVI